MSHRPDMARQRGRTLLELLIAMAIGIVVLGAMLVIYLSTHASGRQGTAVTRLNEDAAIALNLMGARLRVAGFSMPRRDAPSGGALFNGVTMAVPDRNFMGAGIRGCDHGFIDPGAESFDSLACATESTGPAAFAVRHEGAGPDDPLAALLPPAEDCLNQAVASDTAGLSGLSYPLVESRFMVQVGASSGTPELYCAGSGGSSPFAAHPIMQFVEHMAIRYGIAADGASRDVQRYVTAADIDALGGTVDQRWSRVVTVRLCLVMRSAQRQVPADGAYRDCSGEPTTSNDGFLRRAYGSVFTLRNRGGFAGASS